MGKTNNWTIKQMKGDNGQPLACYSAIVLFHEIAHAAVHYDNDLTVKFENHSISPRGCQICEKYKSELAGTSRGRPLKIKGGRKRLGHK